MVEKFYGQHRVTVNAQRRLFINGEYVTKKTKCECGRSWTHVVFGPEKSWWQSCEYCAHDKNIVDATMMVMTRTELFEIAQPPRKVVVPKNRGNWRTRFWHQEVLPWVLSQPKPVTLDIISQQFNRRVENTRAELYKLVRHGRLDMIVVDRRTNRKAFKAKEN